MYEKITTYKLFKVIFMPQENESGHFKSVCMEADYFLFMSS